MVLDRWVALILLAVCLIYGYTAFFTMDSQLPPFMQRNPVWPSTFPKVLSVAGAVLALMILLGMEKTATDTSTSELDYRKLFSYKIGQAVLLISLMVLYALMLRPAGFMIATAGFLILGPLILGERRLQYIIPAAVTAALIVWYLVQQVLGIFLRPWPYFLN
ncbi:hypothetical protein AB833_24235 [Chromatiales bacterium (ex Bugula neritina AB1)]|nr:hypothetical protein AB833_24235 [Chromatiales bacterium (ex Bugula neritina AB1)]